MQYEGDGMLRQATALISAFLALPGLCSCRSPRPSQIAIADTHADTFPDGGECRKGSDAREFATSADHVPEGQADSRLGDLVDSDVGPVGPCGDGVVPPWVSLDGGRLFLASCKDMAIEVTIQAPAMVLVRYQPEGLYAPACAILDQEWPPVDLSFGTAPRPADGTFRICTTELVVAISPETCAVRVTDSSGAVLVEDAPEGAWRTGQEEVDGTAVPTTTLERIAGDDERFYGFGEKTGPLDRRGRSMVFWNTDTPGYSSSADPLYQSIPFFVGLREGTAYGVLVDNSHRLRLDMGSNGGSGYSVTAFGGEMATWVFAGAGIRDVVERYTKLTGRAPLPPRWTLGYHQSRWSYHPAEKVVEICQEFRKRSIPADGIWLDIDYMDGFRSWTWDPAGFPDPSGLVKTLADLGFKTTAIIDPALKADPEWPLYQEGVEQGHFLLGKVGDPFLGVVWPGAAAYPDFTRPETRAWWAMQVPALTDYGVRGIWLDMNEPANFLKEDGNTVPSWVAAAGDGLPTTMAEAHNVYAMWECAATREGMQDAAPDRRPFLLTRAGFAGIQRYSAVWTGDAPTTWDGLRQTLPMLLNLGLSGVAFVGSDVGGWTGGATPELFARWLQVGSISPFFRGHVQTGAIDQEPWAFGVEVEDISRMIIEERYRQLPYIYSLFADTGNNGAPVLRPLVYEFQSDPDTHGLGDEAMLGPWLLFAPVIEEGAHTRKLYLPEGDWLELHSSARHKGPGWISPSVTLQALPVFLKSGAILPRGPVMQHSDEKPLDPLQLDVFPGSQDSKFTFYEDPGDHPGGEGGLYRRVEWTLAPNETGATLKSTRVGGGWNPSPRNMVVRARTVDHPAQGVSLDGAPLEELGGFDALDSASEGWWWDENDRSLWVKLTDRDAFALGMTYDPAPADVDPPVYVTFKVQVPSGTPPDETVHVALSSSNWAQLPLGKPDASGVVQGAVEVPRGEWFEYKFSRGDWATVEKWNGCLETTNRYAFGKAHPVKEDKVEMWADACGAR